MREGVVPVLAGALFDRSGSYASTVWVAAGINVLGMLAAAFDPVADSPGAAKRTRGISRVWRHGDAAKEIEFALTNLNAGVGSLE